MNAITPARIGLLVDTARDPDNPCSEDVLRSATVRHGTIEGLVS